VGLEGRVAILTGGTGALGRAVARHFARAGARLHVPWIVENEVERFREELGELASGVTLHRADLTDPAAVDAFVRACVEREGRLDVLANLAGGFVYAPIEETSPETWQRMVEMNATTCFLCCRATVPAMRRQRWGRIINVSARPAVLRGAAGMSAYAASKAAVLKLTQSLAEELAPDGITANAIVPSIIDTPANRAAMPEADHTRWLPPDEIARVIAFLASDDARTVTGAAITLSL